MFHRTKRLFLRPVFPEDWRAIYDGIAHHWVVKNLATAPWPYTEQDAKDFVQLTRAPQLPNFALFAPDVSTAMVGQAGLGIDAETDRVQLGYWIARDHWGQGYATEATMALLILASILGHKVITASHFLDNPASGKVLLKAGFKSTGVIRPGYSLARGGYDEVACYEANLQEMFADRAIKVEARQSKLGLGEACTM